MDRPLAILPEIDLVEIGFEYQHLVVMELEQVRHKRLIDLATHLLFLAEEQVLDQLLGQGTATLQGLAGSYIDKQSSRDRLWIDTPV